MVPQSQPRKKRNSSKVNLLISFSFHAVILIVAFYFAARSGMLGKQMKKIAVEMVKEKPPEKPKEPEKKPEPPKVETKEPPKVEEAKVVELPKVTAPPPDSTPSVAPPPVELGAFNFEGGATVESSGDPVEIYKGTLQYAFSSKWKKPEHISDDNLVTEVQVSVAPDGRISNPKWIKSSGNSEWDDSVRQAIAAVTNMSRPPPPRFPGAAIIRFDVQQETEPILQ